MADDKKALEEITDVLIDIRDQIAEIKEALQKIVVHLEDYQLPPQARNW